MEIELLAWVMVRDGQGRVLLGRRAGTGLAEGLWNLPGGHVEPGESVAQAGARETAEEVGVFVAPEDLAVRGVQRWSVGGASGFNILLAADRWTGDPTPLENTSEVAWFDPDAPPADILPWLPAVLARVSGGALWWDEVPG